MKLFKFCFDNVALKFIKRTYFRTSSRLYGVVKYAFASFWKDAICTIRRLRLISRPILLSFVLFQFFVLILARLVLKFVFFFFIFRFLNRKNTKIICDSTNSIYRNHFFRRILLFIAIIFYWFRGHDISALIIASLWPIESFIILPYSCINLTCFANGAITILQSFYVSFVANKCRIINLHS